MTQSPRDIATIEAAIAGISKMLTDVEKFMNDLRNEPTRVGDFVVGFPQYGRFITRKGELTNALKCGVWSAEDRGHAMGMRVTNGNGEVAVVVGHGRALAMVLTMQQDLHMQLCGHFRDLLQELIDTRAYEADMNARADVEAAAYAAEQDYYGMAEERARHP
jgi:hypothetical protein